MNRIIILLVSFASLCVGCKKSKPRISLRDQNTLLVGEWSLDKISSSGTGVSGTPGTPTSAGATTEFYKPTTLKLNVDQTASLNGYYLRRDVDTTSHELVTGSWRISDETLTLIWDGNDVYNPEIQEYDLKTLSKKELDISYQRVNSSGGMTSDFTFVYYFKKQ